MEQKSTKVLEKLSVAQKSEPFLRGILEQDISLIFVYSFFSRPSQSLTGYLRKALVFVWNSTLRESSISVFQVIFTSTGKILISGGWGETQRWAI